MAVRKRRGRLGIPNNFPQRRVWQKEEIAQLGQITDKEIAQRLQIPIYDVIYKRRSLGRPNMGRSHMPWTPAELSMLGTMSDEDLASRLGVGLTRVRGARERRRIPIWRQPNATPVSG